MAQFNQTGQKVGVQVNFYDNEAILHRLVDTQTGETIDTAYLTVDEAYRRNKKLSNEPYRWRLSHGEP